MMTPAQYDRLERLARLLCEAAGRDLRKSRQQTKKLKLYDEALKQVDAAELASKERPDCLELKEILLSARQLLDQARQDLKH